MGGRGGGVLSTSILVNGVLGGQTGLSWSQQVGEGENSTPETFNSSEARRKDGAVPDSSESILHLQLASRSLPSTKNTSISGKFRISSGALTLTRRNHWLDPQMETSDLMLLFISVEMVLDMFVFGRNQMLCSLLSSS